MPLVAAATRPAVGIDFGTTNSAVGAIEAGDVRLVPNAEGGVVTPSVVAIAADGTTLIGAAAQPQAITNPDLTVHSVKLKLGTNWSIERNGVRHTAEDLTAMILRQLADNASNYLGTTVRDVVLTIPAYFNDLQRHALIRAATSVGINVLRVVNEPTAAAITYGLNRAGEQRVLIFDLGGGTFDVSLLEIGDGVCEVKAVSSDNQLGGDNWDQRLIDHLLADVVKSWRTRRSRTRRVPTPAGRSITSSSSAGLRGCPRFDALSSS